jgi:regulator of nonsense transcripts 1
MARLPQCGDIWGASVEPPIIKFSDADEFRARHEVATKEEYKLQEQLVDAFNRKNPVFRAWVILAPPPKQSWIGYVLRINLNRMPEGIEQPGIGQSCKLRLVDSDGTPSSWFPCRSGAEILSLNQSWSKLSEFVIYPPESDIKKFSDCLVPLVTSGPKAKSLRQETARWIDVQLQLEASRATMMAELGALNQLTTGNAAPAGKSAFRYLMDFEPKTIADLTETFPHLSDLDQITDDKLRASVKKVIDNFDEDQQKAFEGITHLPERICFVPGGPGAGKTWWALTMAHLAQAGDRRCQILYLLDINKPVDDAANRMYAMCRETGKSIIRVRSWPLAGSDSRGKGEDEEDENGLPRALKNADFTEGFIRAMQSMVPRETGRAPTLDEKAWECYADQPERYGEVESALGRVLAVDDHCRDPQEDMRTLRRSLIHLYHEVLTQADFIATTPVAAPRLRNVYKPDIVIFDECAHARELSTMISLAYFDPKAWFFVGDHRQTEPFFEARHCQYALQMKMSTMERAARNDAVTYQLLVNHRAYGGLERLASDLFYDGAMRSNKEGNEVLPESVIYLRRCLSKLAEGNHLQGDLRTPRLIVSCPGAFSVQPWKSSWNPKHHEFVMKQVGLLLDDRSFLQVDSSDRGTIMILSPYRAAVQKYEGAVKQFPSDLRQRVQVRTVDTAQGQEADVVFLDMVRTARTPHLRNVKRLCVALTRARQAEIIMMSASLGGNSEYEDTDKLGGLWHKCQSGEQGAIVTIYDRRSPSPVPDSGGWGGAWGASTESQSELSAAQVSETTELSW